jgi:hypothetical protein
MKYLNLYSRVFLEIHENHFYVNENSHTRFNVSDFIVFTTRSALGSLQKNKAFFLPLPA